MIRSSLSLIAAALAVAAMSAAPAMATDDGPGQLPPAPPAPPAGGVLGQCTDHAPPLSRLASSSRTASRSHLLRGTSRDLGCGTNGNGRVAHVSISVKRKVGARCKFLTRAHKLSRATSCKHSHWLAARGGAHWTFRLPRRLAHGTYAVAVHAADSAGNVERAHARRLRIR